MEIHVCCAVIIDAFGKILVCRRKQYAERGGKWEFPGGKIESGESREDCLRREIMEELGVEIRIGIPLIEVHHAYPDKDIILCPFICRLEDNFPIRLIGHDSALWVEKSMLADLDWSEADLGVVNQLLEA